MTDSERAAQEIFEFVRDSELTETVVYSGIAKDAELLPEDVNDITAFKMRIRQIIDRHLC